MLQHAREQADVELEAAKQEAADLRTEFDDYVDTKLAGLEVAWERSLQTVRRGRKRLASGDGTAATGLGELTAEVESPGGHEPPGHLEGPGHLER